MLHVVNSKQIIRLLCVYTSHVFAVVQEVNNVFPVLLDAVHTVHVHFTLYVLRRWMKTFMNLLFIL